MLRYNRPFRAFTYTFPALKNHNLNGSTKYKSTTLLIRDELAIRKKSDIKKSDIRHQTSRIRHQT